MKSSSKIIKLEDISKKLNDLQINTVGLCHGVFDLLHIGHIKYFQEAKALSEILIVTLTPDKWVNKGPGRPAFTQDLRAEAIAALDCVDFVAINIWPTAIETIELIKPCFYIKGPDYKTLSEDITGNILKEKTAVESIGGKLIFTSDEIYSSSTLINEMKKRNDWHPDSSWWDIGRKDIHFEQILEGFESIEKLKVCVIGENITDLYSNYRPLGRSSKGASLVFEKGTSESYEGGSLAAAKNLSALHNDVTLITNKILNPSSSSINIKDLDIGNNIIKERILDNHTSEKVIEFYNNNFEISWDSDSEAKFSEFLKEESYDVVICFDFGHGFFTKQIIKNIESLGSFLALNVQTNAGNRGHNFPTKWNRADLLSITDEELALTLQDKTLTLTEKVKKLKEKVNFSKIVVTLGAAGNTIFDGALQVSTPAFAEGVKDRVGAGDTFLVSIAGHVFQDELNINSIGLIGNLAGAQSLKHPANKEVLNKESLLKSIEHILK
jgi:rfaE bifunctional protein nucleotidyltransferase chain/domain